MATDIIARGMAGSTKKALDEYKNNPDVSDIVATKADLTNYDTSKLNVNDIVKVLVDESQDNKQTYYKWDGSSFQYIGGLGPYYTTTEIDNKIDASHCYLIGDDDLNVDTGEISSRFKNIIDNKATFKYVGTDNSSIIIVNNTNAINKTFIPVEDKDADSNGFYLYQTTYVSVDTAQPEISIIKFYVSNSNILTTELAAHSSLSDIGWVSPQIVADSDDYIYLDQEGILCIPNLFNALLREINERLINATKIFNFQLLDNNNLINTLPENTKIFLGNSSSNMLPLLDINSDVTFDTGELVAPIMTVGSIKRFRICDDDPILKDSYIFSGYIQNGGQGIVVITERSTTESYYKVELTDYNLDSGSELNLLLAIRKTDFDDVLVEINTQMGTNLQTPQDLIDFYDTVKGNSTYYGGCCLLFAGMTLACIKSNTNAVYIDYDVRGYNKITLASTSIPMIGSDDMVVISALAPSNLTSITFTSNSTLTITEQNNQDL